MRKQENPNNKYRFTFSFKDMLRKFAFFMASVTVMSMIFSAFPVAAMAEEASEFISEIVAALEDGDVTGDAEDEGNGDTGENGDNGDNGDATGDADDGDATGDAEDGGDIPCMHIDMTYEYTEATCTEYAYYTGTCKSCGFTETIYQTDTPITGHTWSDWITILPPTYTDYGEQERECLVCGITEYYFIPPYRINTVISNYTITMALPDNVKEIKYALGYFTTGNEVRNAEKNQTLSASVIQANTDEYGNFVYDLPWEGQFTLWIRFTDGTSTFTHPYISTDPYIESKGLKLTVKDFGEDYKDMWIAEGTWNTYTEIKNNATVKYQASAKKLSNYFATHDFTYTCANPGEHTVLIRYNDGSTDVIHTTLTVDVPILHPYGLQILVSNLPDVKIIRTASGYHTSVASIKNAPDVRNFNSKTAIKGADPYTIQYRKEGIVTVIVEYNTGYKHIQHINIEQKKPSFRQDGDTVTIGDLNGLVMVRYAPGVHTTSGSIKNAEGSKYIKPVSAVNGIITVSDLPKGTYTFCVQYDDESYNYYTIDVV